MEEKGIDRGTFDDFIKVTDKFLKASLLLLGFFGEDKGRPAFVREQH